ncbi:MAG: nitroreductase family protein [Candidatus Zixiibacteriota bacterium]|nr:MAG: nitroreductase family protein [candidate division Zixibacteria bacterium]
MGPKVCGGIAAIFCLMFVLIGGSAVYSQMWWEDSGEKHDYNLSGYRFLIVLGEDFDYQETVVVKQFWEKWGAKVYIAGTGLELTGHLWKRTEKGWDRSETKRIQTDLLLSEVDLSTYQAIFFPGGNSPKSLLETEGWRVIELIQQADKKGLVLAAICHGPQVLAAAGVVKGRKVTGHHEVAADLTGAGAEYVNQVCVVDENTVTGNWPYFETMAIQVAERVLYPRGGGPSEKSPFETDPVLKAIKERRSVRGFQERDVEESKIELILKAATWAPSANNDQPWKFVVVKSKDTKQKILNAFLDRMKDYYEGQGIPLDRVEPFWAGIWAAPVHIFALCDTSVVEIEEGWEETETLWSAQGVSAACQNMLLAAHALGLGSVWTGGSLAVEDEIKSMLDVPEGVKLMTVIAVGYPAHEPLPPVRRPLSDVMFFEKWGNK